jgi:hypothetical protein
MFTLYCFIKNGVLCLEDLIAIKAKTIFEISLIQDVFVTLRLLFQEAAPDKTAF